MSLRSVQIPLAASRAFSDIRQWFAASDEPESAAMTHAAGSLVAFLIPLLNEQGRSFVCCITDDAERAAYLQSDLQQVQRSDEGILLLPPSDHRPYDPEHVADPAPLIQRADVLQQLADGFTGILIASLEAVVERVPRKDDMRSVTVELTVGDDMDPAALIERLVKHGFTHTEFVEQPGDLAMRGGILDVFPFVGAYPVRFEFFGNEIDSIREFDIHTQRSVSRLTSARIVPNLEDGAASPSERTPLFDHFPPNTRLVLFDDARILETAEADLEASHLAFSKLDPETVRPPGHWYLGEADLEQTFASYRRLITGSFVRDHGDLSFSLNARPQPVFNSSVAALRRQLAQNARTGLKNIILCDSRGQENRLRELLEADLDPLGIQLTVESLHEGFELPDLGLVVYTDHQIFNRYHRPTTRRQKQSFGGLSLRELQQLAPGDFVVHVDYGIGRFAGLDQIEVRGKHQEAVRLLYHGTDVLYVNVNALHKLHKYKGKDGHHPQLTKLGSGQWEKKKARAKSRVKDIARDLIKLYAQRKQSNGHAFPRDSVWQREMEASFAFEDTPDQAAAAEAVKNDMEQPVPMDRLVCGDVGFGKTEVAIRAAFKAAQEGRQVAVLVPTTVLAAQHHATFSKRLSRYPVRVDVLSRFRSAAEQKTTLDDLASGKVDILVGTHRLISADVKFRDLGLLVVDEEQRFGVGVKEKLRKLRVNVDTLTLTATPIPRTLQFSLMGARDLSIMATAPPNRQPIVTEIHTFDKDLIRDAIRYEVSRGGQVFFIHNRVQSIQEMASTLRAILPDIRVLVGHGQMKGPDLERVMMQFVQGKAEVLISTSIVENGLDISNANTIILDRADHFGLAELHQLRGRVGRSDRKAFCYLLVPSIHGLTREARQRLQAVEELSELGSGFQIAMRDLDIRGAGNMLGAEQSGFIEDVGFETYHRILDEAVQELRSEEFADVFDQPAAPRAEETTLDVDADALIPEAYLANRVERLNLYRRIGEADTVEVLEDLRAEMADRFGPPPSTVENLLESAVIKMLAQQLRLQRVVFKNQRLFLVMHRTEDDEFFFEQLFHPLLERLSKLDHRYVLKESSAKRLRAIIQDVPTLSAARELLRSLQPEAAT